MYDFHFPFYYPLSLILCNQYGPTHILGFTAAFSEGKGEQGIVNAVGHLELMFVDLVLSWRRIAKVDIGICSLPFQPFHLFFLFGLYGSFTELLDTFSQSSRGYDEMTNTARGKANVTGDFIKDLCFSLNLLGVV